MGAYGTHGVELLVGMAFGYTPYATPAWTDVAKYVHRFTVTRGGVRTTLPRSVAGRMTLTLDNDDDRFDPNNTASPYSPDVLVSVPVRIRVTYNSVTYPLFYGFVKSWDMKYGGKGLRSTAVVTAVDGIQLLNQHDISEFTYPRQDTDTRVAAVLDDVGWPSGLRNIDAAISAVEAFDQETPVTAYSHLLGVAASEVGRVFVAADGDLTFHNRIHHSGGSVPEGTFGPASSDLPYSDVDVSYNDSYLYNDIRITRSDGAIQTTSDAASVTAYGHRTLSVGGIMYDDNAAKGTARWYKAMYKDIDPRISRIVVKPQTDPVDLWPVALGVDLRDSIVVKVVPKGGGDDLDQQVSVDGIRHDVTVDKWTVSLDCYPLSSLETDTFWSLGSSTLDNETTLA